MFYRITCFVTACCILFSCASSYKPIIPRNLNYGSEGGADGVQYAYRYDVLAGAGNKKYAKKEVKKTVKVVAVKFENKSDKAIVFRNDIDVLAGNKLIHPMETRQIHQQLKQPAPLYLLWGLLFVTINKCENDDCTSTPIPVGLGIGVVNVAIASGANKKFFAEMQSNNLLDKTIQPGETVYGVIGLPVDAPDALTFKVK